MFEITEFGTAAAVYVGKILSLPFDPSARIFWLYLLSSVAFAYVVYRSIRRNKHGASDADIEIAQGSFVQFLFPKTVWGHPSAWLDLRYALFHKIVSDSTVFGIKILGFAFGFYIVTGSKSISDLSLSSEPASATQWAIGCAYMVATVIVVDFVSWFLHYLQHKNRFLWQFHKVHHSAEVMHPISNYREHPVDNLTYAAFTGLVFGTSYALMVTWFDFSPTMPMILGVPALVFLFDFLAYNLRHSHVWLRWPGRLSAIFPSPAHHHVHHSCHPDHIDKNFAFIFPIWDVIFGTYEMPENNRDVKFGVPEYDGRDLDGVFKLYWVPFRDAYRLIRRDVQSCDTALDDRVPGTVPRNND